MLTKSIFNWLKNRDIVTYCILTSKITVFNIICIPEMAKLKFQQQIQSSVSHDPSEI